MISTAKRMMKGVLNKTNRKKSKSNFEAISWLQEKIIKHQEDTRVKQLIINDSTFFYRRPYEFLHTYKEIFEKELYRFNTASKNPVIIDCGSNIGISVLYYKKLFPQCTIHAFEPDDQNFLILKKNVEINNLQDVQLHASAVWHTDGFVSFEGGGSEASHIDESFQAGNRIPSVRLKTILEKIKEIDFLKIDIEGAEWHVLNDCASTLHGVNNLFLEYHGKSFQTRHLADLLGIVDSAGFSVYIRNAADGLRYPFEQKQTSTAYDVQLNLFCYRK